MSVIEFIEGRIEYFKSKREMLKQVKGTHDERHYVQGKLNELQYLKKSLKKKKFSKICPHCRGEMTVLTVPIDSSNFGFMDISQDSSPLVRPYSLDSSDSLFQKLICQMKCTVCGKYYNVIYSFEDIKEVDFLKDVWYDRNRVATPEKDQSFLSDFLESTRRRVLKAFNKH